MEELVGVETKRWWGQWELGQGAAIRWRVGSSSLWFGRRDPVGVFATQVGRDVAAAELEIEQGLSVEDIPADHVVTRFALPDGIEHLTLTPRLADRPVVVRPETTFVLPPHAEIRAFVSTPVWACIDALDDLAEVPLHRPSDTWFGATPLDGELCYAVKTNLRVSLDLLPRRPQRAITALRIRNEGSDSLVLHRVRLPMSHLRILVSADDQLWTEEVALVRKGGDEASVQVLRGAPAEAAGAVALGEPREVDVGTRVLRVFNSFLH